VAALSKANIYKGMKLFNAKTQRREAAKKMYKNFASLRLCVKSFF
jgi:hypothetical protein